MEPRRIESGSQLTALMIAPDRSLSDEFARSLAVTRGFQILAEVKGYPELQTLQMRLRQLQPEVVLLDLATDLDRACELIRFITATSPAVHVVGLHQKNDSDAVVRSLRHGASEFLYAPFDPAAEQQAVNRIRRLRSPEAAPSRELGKVLLFSSAKPGAGASVLAAQAAFALRRLTGKRVLLADLDLMGGTISFYLGLPPRSSLLEALAAGGGSWTSLVAVSQGLDVLAAPPQPASEPVDPARLHEFLERARQLYDWILLDLPAIFHRLTLLALSEADLAYVVATSDLPSLHLARKAVTLLAELGFGKERYHILINRVHRRSELSEEDVSKIINAPVDGSFPNDMAALECAVTRGEPLEEATELGGAIETFAGRLAGVAAAEKKRAAALEA
jgi:pilus assembly protein CpaE